jgi:hypothetical protein
MAMTLKMKHGISLLAMLLAVGCSDSEPAGDTGSDAGGDEDAAAGDDDAAAASAGGGQGGLAKDDPDTLGNDTSEATSCTGTDECNYETHQCCVWGQNDAECKPLDEECGSGGLLGLIAGTPTACDGPEDCGKGDVCCVHVSIDGATSACEPESEIGEQGGRCPATGLIGDWELCHTDADCDSSKLCEATDSFEFWAFCG